MLRRFIRLPVHPPSVMPRHVVAEFGFRSVRRCRCPCKCSHVAAAVSLPNPSLIIPDPTKKPKEKTRVAAPCCEATKARYEGFENAIPPARPCVAAAEKLRKEKKRLNRGRTAVLFSFRPFKDSFKEKSEKTPSKMSSSRQAVKPLLSSSFFSPSLAHLRHDNPDVRNAANADAC